MNDVNDIVIPGLKMAKVHAEMIRDKLGEMDANDPSIAMLKMFAEDVVSEIGSAIKDLEE